MLDYIWLNDKSPILNQLPNKFKSAVILLHPFVKMPLGWGKNNRKNDDEHIYPSDKDILEYGKPVSWKTMLHESGLTSLGELAIALKTSIGALRKQYARKDLAERLLSSIKDDLYYPNEDFTSIFLITDLINVLESKGANQLSYSDPILDKSGTINPKCITPLDFSELSLKELMITDENMDFAFMNVYDSFITILMAKDENIEEIVKVINCETIVCDKDTYINWYSQAY
ncbi:DUF2711 family protein [Neobacillus vireti]|uniref:DUF2711 family protein n=1 Tax=Neobacillus vireti TaxID=220686 RepID=UPI002FFFA5D4